MVFNMTETGKHCHPLWRWSWYKLCRLVWCWILHRDEITAVLCGLGYDRDRNSDGSVWCFKPSQPQRITSGLNTNFTISKLVISQVIIPQSHVFFFFKAIYIPRSLNTGTCIQQGDLFYSAGLHSNHVLATANTGKNRERFWKKYGWMDRKCRNKQERNPWQ